LPGRDKTAAPILQVGSDGLDTTHQEPNLFGEVSIRQGNILLDDCFKSTYREKVHVIPEPLWAGSSTYDPEERELPSEEREERRSVQQLSRSHEPKSGNNRNRK